MKLFPANANYFGFFFPHNNTTTPLSILETCCYVGKNRWWREFSSLLLESIPPISWPEN